MATFVIEVYGILRRLAHTDSIKLEVEPGEYSVQQLLDRLARKYPDMADVLDKTACAINDELVTRDHNISSDQRLALIPPVSGG